MYLSKEGKKLKKYYRHYEEEFYLYLGKTMGSSEESYIHGFRVTIKKLKGVIKLMGLLCADFSSKEQFKPLKMLFKPAGDIRECQVNLKRLKEFPGHEEFYRLYKQARKKCIKAHRQEFDQALSKFKFESVKLTGKALKKHCRILSRESVYINSITFIQERLDLIDEHHVNSKNDTEEVHEIRIQLKEISVVLGLFNHVQAKVVTEEILAILKQYESEIGSWHDYAVLQASVDEFCTRFPDDYKRLASDIHLLKSEIGVEEEAFLTQLDEFVGEVKAVIEKVLKTLDKKKRKIVAAQIVGAN